VRLAASPGHPIAEGLIGAVFMNALSYYRAPKLELSVSGSALALAAGGGAAALLAVVYAFLQAYNPFIYINFLATLGFAYAMGYAATFGARLGKLRSPLWGVALGLLVGFVGLYVTWVAYIYALTLRSGTGFWIFDPVRLANVIGLLAQKGAWSMFGVKPTGAVLYILWAVEAVVLVGGPVWILRGATAEPYCDACDKWTEEQHVGTFGACTDPALLRQKLETRQFQHLARLQNDPLRCTAVVLHQCPECSEKVYLTVQRITVVPTEDGQEEKHEDVVRYLELDCLAQQALDRVLFPPAKPSTDAAELSEAAELA
jgi:hypothetical protein